MEFSDDEHRPHHVVIIVSAARTVVKTEDRDQLLPEVKVFHSRFSGYVCRTEGRAMAQSYLGGLRLPLESKSIENVAEEVGFGPRACRSLSAPRRGTLTAASTSSSASSVSTWALAAGSLSSMTLVLARRERGRPGLGASTRGRWGGRTTARWACSWATPRTRATHWWIGVCT